MLRELSQLKALNQSETFINIKSSNPKEYWDIINDGTSKTDTDPKAFSIL